MIVQCEMAEIDSIFDHLNHSGATLPIKFSTSIHFASSAKYPFWCPEMSLPISFQVGNFHVEIMLQI